MRIAMVLMLLSLSNAVRVFGQEARAVPEVRTSLTGLSVELRTSQEIVSRGERMHVWFSTGQNAFVTVLRIDTDGRVRMLFPERPWHNSFVQAGELLEVRNPACDNADCAFVIDDYPGQGYVFAIASLSPFELDSYANGDYWDYSAIAQRGRVAGDPFVAISSLMSRMIPEAADGESSYDVYPYHVGSQFEYPRFLCYECHTFVRYPAWNPYQRSCTRFQMVRYDEPEYHPSNAYGATRAVHVRPQDLKPRFVFENRTADAPFVSTRTERPTSSFNRRSTRAGSTARNVGDIGSVPAPLGNRGTAPDTTPLRLTPLERAIRDGRVASERNDTAATRPQPQLLRRAAKPDSSRKPSSSTQPLTPSPAAESPRILPANPIRPLRVIGPRSTQNVVRRVQTRVRRTKPDTSEAEDHPKPSLSSLS